MPKRKGYIFDKLASEENIFEAYKRARSGHKKDREVIQFEEHRAEGL